MSSASQVRRRHQRVSFCAPVGVHPVALHQQSIAGCAHNVSEGGMFVNTSAVVAIGTELTCALPIDGTQHRVRARVAWIHRGADGVPVGMGLQFEQLTAETTRALRSVMTPAPAHGDRVRVWFDGVRGTANVHAEAITGGAVLRAPLPFLGLGRSVHLARGDEVPVPARVASVAICTDTDRVPHLRIELVHGEAHLVTEPVRVPTPRPASPHVQRALIAGGAVLALAAMWGLGRWSAEPVAAHAVAPIVIEGPAPLPLAPTPAPPAPALPPPPREVGPAHVAAPLAAPRVTIGDKTVIEIPLEGSTHAARHYRLDDPPGLAINLPEASVGFALGDTVVERGGVRFVRVAARKGGIQIRLHFTAPGLRYDVAIDDDLVTITLAPR